MDRIFQLMQVGQGSEIDGGQGAAPLIGQLGGALARLGGAGQAPGQGAAGGPADGFNSNPGDPAAGAQAAANMNPLLAGLASWGQDQKIQQEANQVLQAKGIETGGSGQQQPQSAPGAGGQQQDVGALVKQLQQDYERAKKGGVNLTTQTEQLAKKALEGEEQQQQQDQNAGGADGASGGGNAPQGSSGSNSSGGSNGAQSSGMAPQDISQDRATGNLTADASKMLDASLQGNKDFDNVFGQFGQGTEGNCAAVASIKAAMDVYDNKVFDSVTKGEDGGYTIKMQDGKEVKVSAGELGMAAKASNFNGPDSEAKSYAIMSYAAMAKRAQMEGHEGARTYGQALNSLNNGDDPYDSARFLGLKNQVQNVDPQRANGGNAVVAWNSKHAVYVDSTRNGTKTDHYGQAYNYDGTDTRGRALTNGFTFRPRATTPSSPSTSSSSVPGAGSTASTPSSSVSSTRSSSSSGSSGSGSSGSSGGGSSSSTRTASSSSSSSSSKS